MPGKLKRRATSVRQRKAIAIAEHHPEQLYARNKGLKEMTHAQQHEMASVSEKHLPEHKGGRRKLKRRRRGAETTGSSTRHISEPTPKKQHRQVEIAGHNY